MNLLDPKRVKIFTKFGAASRGKMQAILEPADGDGTCTVFRFTEGQWGSAEVRQIDDGVEIRTFGEFERAELIEFFRSLPTSDMGGGSWISED
jgi:hypothetical protein